jgi:DNA-binding beta-propeller fold protein YncE
MEMQKKASRLLFPVALLAFSLMILTGISFWKNSLTAAAHPAEDTFTYLPIVFKPVPIVPPQFVKNVTLPDAQCPNSVGFNAISGYVYVANNFSYNVSAFKNANFVTDIPMGKWPTLIAADNDSPLTYVTALHDGVTVIDGTTVVGKIPKNYEPYGVVVNPVNGNTYITDLDSTVQVANGLSLLTNVSIIDPEIAPPNNGAGWLQPIVVDPNTGLVYVASWSHGKMYVLDGNSVVANYRAGWGVKDMAIDTSRGYIYLAHSEPNAIYPHNISVFNIATQTFTYIDTDPGSLNNSRDVTVDPISGYAYFTNPDQNTVTVVKGTQVMGTLPAGSQPWGIGVNPNTGYVFVANRASNTITVIRELSVVNTIPAQGLQPFAVGVDTINNDVYIANRGDEYGLFECRDASVTILR